MAAVGEASNTIETGEIDGSLTTAGQLFLWFPVGLAARRVCQHLAQIGCNFNTTWTGAVTVEAPNGYPDELIAELGELLSPHESADTRCVFKAGYDDLDVEDIARVRTIDELHQLRRSSWFVDILRDDRLTSVFQPIVLASETSKVFGHEALMRGIGDDGSTLSAARLLEAARTCGMMPELDCAARRSAIAIAANQEERRPLFINFTAEALRDGARSLAPTIRAMEFAEIPRERVIFELIDAERSVDVNQLRTVVDSVRAEGFRVAFDDIGVEEHSRRLIHTVRPDYIKVDMQRMRGASEPMRDDAERLFSLAQTLKIETIAEGVETSEELAWNRARGATYVQGFYIARPGELGSSIL
ncbi:MAG TPA: EAL domain-containing protein [Gemmatimonadaceae bacterium]|jgi:EAL domain-containing protein (putative c-di-GMP-specific phosphodiesterase class I)